MPYPLWGWSYSYLALAGGLRFSVLRVAVPSNYSPNDSS